MSYTYYIDPLYNEFRVVDNTLLIARGQDTIKQQLELALKTQLNEWYLDTTVGIPYFYADGSPNDNSDPGILGGKYSAAEISAILRKVILETPGVLSISTFELGQIDADRSITVKSSVVIDATQQSGIGTQTVILIEVTL